MLFGSTLYSQLFLLAYGNLYDSIVFFNEYSLGKMAFLLLFFNLNNDHSWCHGLHVCVLPKFIC